MTMEELFTTNYYPDGLITIFVAIIVAYIGLNILWNRKWVPLRRAKGQPTPYFGNTMNRVLRFAFKEDPRTLFPKKITNKWVKKLLTLRTINVILLVVTFALILLQNVNAYIPALILITSIWVQTNQPLTDRNRSLTRMYAVAASTFRYGKGAELNPWGYVKIKKWEDLTTPGETHISIPANWDSSSQAARDGFEAHFNTTVTDTNSWIYEWQSAKGQVVARPISHLPTMAPYPGSEKHPWHVIPLGLGASGEVTVDLASSPHMLVCGSTGSGKALGLNTRVFTKIGFKTIGDLNVGDIVYDENGKEATVTHLHPIFTPETAYEMEYANGEKVIVDANHLWNVKEKTSRNLSFLNDNRRQYLDDETKKYLEQLLETVSDTHNMSLREFGELLDKPETDKILVFIAEQVGVAEQVNVTKVNRTQNVNGTEMVTKKFVNTHEFIELYNNREPYIPTKETPLSRSQFDKLFLLQHEVRNTDKITVASVIEYLNISHPEGKKFVETSFDENLNPVEAVKRFIVAAEPKSSLFPEKIFNIKKKPYINSEDLCALFNVFDEHDTQIVVELFDKLTTICVDTENVTEEVPIVETVLVNATQEEPYFTYPTKLFLQKLLQHTTKEIFSFNDISSSVKTTEEILLTLQSTEHFLETVSINETEATVPVDPYLFGYWLAQQNSKGIVVSPTEIAEETIVSFRQLYPPLQKHFSSIPHPFFVTNIQQKMELLCGLTQKKSFTVSVGEKFCYTTTHVAFAEQIKQLISSTGNIVHTTYNNKKITLTFTYNPNNAENQHQIVSITPIEGAPMRCLSVNSPSRQFTITSSFIPTHNSVLQRNIVFHCIQHNDMMRFLGVDVKRVELSVFKKFKNTVLGIGTNLEDGVEIVRYAKEVMNTRYEEMEEAGVNHFKDLIDPVTGKPPYALLLMIDEAFMFMSPEGGKSEEGKMRDELHAEASIILGDIARLGRASGVHIVLATQRPDATVIKGELKANLDIRIAAGRLDSTPSAMVLDSGAATQLPKIKGRGIVRFGGEQEQFQGYFAEMEWIDSWLKKNPTVEPSLVDNTLVDEDGFSGDFELPDELEKIGEGYDFEDGEAVTISGNVSVDEETLNTPTVVTETPQQPLTAPASPELQPSIQNTPTVPPAPVTGGFMPDYGDVVVPNLLGELSEKETLIPKPPAPNELPGLTKNLDDIDEAEAEAYLAEFYGKKNVEDQPTETINHNLVSAPTSDKIMNIPFPKKSGLPKLPPLPPKR